MKSARTLTLADAPAMPATGAAAAVVYGSGVLHGLVLVSVPASSAILRAHHGFTDAQYGTAFLPQVAMAVIGAVAGSAVARRAGLRALLLLSLLAAAASQGALAATAALPAAAAFAGLLVATGLLGLGFGLAGAPLNTWPARLYPGRGSAALVAMHTAIGIGLTGGPLLAGVLMDRWVAFPGALLALAALLAMATRRLPRERPSDDGPRGSSTEAPAPARSIAFWLFAAIAVLYAFAEGTFSSWAVIFLRESRGLADATAAAGLSVFWGALVAGRLLSAVLLLRVPAGPLWAGLPVAMVIAFLAMPSVAGPVSGLLLFALAGLACSAFFPLTIGMASARFPVRAPWVASMLTAALMLGVGVGTFAIGGLRAALDFDALYRGSALYPAVSLALMFALRRLPEPRS